MSSAARRERDALRLRALQLDDVRRQPMAGGRVVPPQPISAAAGALGLRGRRLSHEGGGKGGGPSYDYDAAPAPAGFAPDVVGGSSRNAMLQAKLARKQQENLRREQELRVRFVLSVSFVFFGEQGQGRCRTMTSMCGCGWLHGVHTQGVRENYYEERKRADQLQKEQYSHNGARVQVKSSLRPSVPTWRGMGQWNACGASTRQRTSG